MHSRLVWILLEEHLPWLTSLETEGHFQREWGVAIQNSCKPIVALWIPNADSPPSYSTYNLWLQNIVICCTICNKLKKCLINIVLIGSNIKLYGDKYCLNSYGERLALCPDEPFLCAAMALLNLFLDQTLPAEQITSKDGLNDCDPMVFLACMLYLEHNL